MFSLKGKVAFITGSARGIGYSCAEKLAECGAAVVIADVNETQAAASAETLRSEGYRALSVSANVGDNESIQGAISKAVDQFGCLDILVNCAGILSAATIETMQRDDWNRVQDINLGGTFFSAQAALPYLKQSQAGRIINISSISGRNGGFEGAMSYAASKGGIIAVTRGMARRLARTGITVNAVCPGPIETEILKGYTPEAVERQKSQILLGRLGRPEEVAAAVCYLASEEAAFVTGIALDVNGGAFIG